MAADFPTYPGYGSRVALLGPRPIAFRVARPMEQSPVDPPPPSALPETERTPEAKAAPEPAPEAKAAPEPAPEAKAAPEPAPEPEKKPGRPRNIRKAKDDGLEVPAKRPPRKSRK